MFRKLAGWMTILAAAAALATPALAHERETYTTAAMIRRGNTTDCRPIRHEVRRHELRRDGDRW